MGNWICPDACLDNYVSPPTVNIPGLPRYYGLGDDFSKVVGAGDHNSELQGICGTSETYADVVSSVTPQGTDGGVFKSIANWVIKGDGTLELQTSLQHNVGPFGKIILPSKAKYWCRPWGSIPILKEFFLSPWICKDQFSPTYQRLHVVIPVKTPLTYDLVKSGKTLYYKYNVVATVGSGTNIPTGAGIAKDNLLFELVGHTGATTLYSYGISNLDKWRKVTDPNVNVELVLWLPTDIIMPGTGDPMPDSMAFGKDPGLFINLIDFRMQYRTAP